MNWILQRVTDWRRERRIRALAEVCKRHLLAGSWKDARPHAKALTAEIVARSPQQLARMERRVLARMDPHSRALYERTRKRHA